MNRTARFIRRQVYRRGHKGPQHSYTREGWQEIANDLAACIGKRPPRIRRRLGLGR
jgi:hypothetical protein